MKLVNVFIIFITLSSCSFDNKTGIWKDANEIVKESKDIKIKKNFKKIFKDNKILVEDTTAPINYNFVISEPTRNSKWIDEQYNGNNNLPNFYYKNSKEKIFKTSRLARNKIDKNIFFSNNNLIFTDERGSVYVYSLSNNKIVFKYNFYKKLYKKIIKKLNILVYNDNIIISDNLGYVYNLNYKLNKIVWAKNFGIPFRSNIKVANNQIFLANADNTIFAINFFNGKKIWNFQTGTSLIKTDYQNNLALDNSENVYFLTDTGLLYSFNYKTRRMNWFIDKKNTYGKDSNVIYRANPIVVDNDKILITTAENISLHNVEIGFEYYNVNLSSKIKPVINQNLIFFITNENFIICMEKDSGNIIWAKDISSFLKTKKLKYLNLQKVTSLKIVNNKIFIFLPNYYLEIDVTSGLLKKANELKFKIKSKPIIVDGNILYLNSKGRLIKLN